MLTAYRRSLTKTGLSFESALPLPFDRVAGPFLRPWQSEVRTESGLKEPEAELDSATMRYIRASRAMFFAVFVAFRPPKG